ncbi:MAG: ABC transporter ATP-binding protein/permease [Lachnospiraceae bacterium]|nr:ABC transporter ATP-binding protein/permease [Lachnospiraceae bacterium]
MKNLWKYFKNYRAECILGPLFKLLEASFELMIPLVIKNIIDVGIATSDTGYIIRYALLMVALGVIGLGCSLTAQFFSAKAAVGFSAKVKQEIFSHIQTLSYSEIDALGTGTLITRLTSDINTLQGGVNMSLRLFLRSPFVVMGAVVMAFTIDAKAALCIALTVLALSLVVYIMMRLTIPLQAGVQSRLDVVLTKTRSNIGGARVIRAFGNEEREKEEFNLANTALNKLQIFSGRISAAMNPLTFALVNAGLAWLIWEGAMAVDTGRLTQGAVVALVNYMSQILVELIKLANLIVQLTRALACGGRVSALLDIESSMKEGTTETACPEDGSHVELVNAGLKFTEGGEYSVKGVNLDAAPGSIIGIIGGTGSGKTSLINMIPRFYDASEGEIKVDGVNVKDYSFASLRGRIAVVPQNPVLFSGSIRDNIRWGKKDADDDEIIKALKTAQAYDFVSEKEGGLSYVLTQGGKNVSGGQRQRLAIARALVRKPGILILDDSTSALDYATDAALRNAIKNLDHIPTTFIVSQRTASIMHADQIIVLDDGAVAGMGTHEELLKNCEIYREIYDSQYKDGTE